MKGNRFENNSGAGVIQLHTSFRSTYGDIQENIFVNNSRVDNENMITIDVKANFDVSLKNNVFSNPAATYDIRTPSYSDGRHIDATGCFWGVTSYGDVISR